ncbi:MAG TPA: TrkA family potassium uptake protein [Opitutales bacterium]|nr:TrkA family potassium uptake protein [Opitutales bacterium]
MKYCVIGLGHFGTNLAIELSREGHEVAGIDHHEDRVEAIKDEIAHAVQGDAMQIAVLEELGVREMDQVIIAIGENFESSLMVASHLQSMEVEKILCREINEVHQRILRLMNIKDVIRPEALAARQLAKRLGIHRATRHFELEGDYAIVQIKLPSFLQGKTIANSELRSKYDCNLITVRQKQKSQGEAEEDSGSNSVKTSDEITIIGVPKPDYEFQEGDELILFGSEDAIKQLSHGSKKDSED